jgi:hypothetical protein
LGGRQEVGQVAPNGACPQDGYLRAGHPTDIESFGCIAAA